jgi:hypothetical protein
LYGPELYAGPFFLLWVTDIIHLGDSGACGAVLPLLLCSSELLKVASPFEKTETKPYLFFVAVFRAWPLLGFSKLDQRQAVFACPNAPHPPRFSLWFSLFSREKRENGLLGVG